LLTDSKAMSPNDAVDNAYPFVYQVEDAENTKSDA
jgi:hypothetical protein